MKLNNWQTGIQDIRFWILLFFVIRLYGITNPPIDPASTWRQCDVLMIARNFYEIDANILFPRIDLGTPEGMIVGVEFPIYNYLIYLLSLLFGYEDWYGRVVNLAASSLALLFLNKTLVRYTSREIAFNATALLLFSGWFSYARVTIPDVFAASLCIIALDFALVYLESGKFSALITFGLLASLGCLSKISAASILTVLAAPMLDRTILWNRKIAVSLMALVVISIVCLWYFYWVPYLNSIGLSGYFFMGKPISEGVREILSNPIAFLREFFETPLKYVGGLLFVLTIFYAFWKKRGLELVALGMPLFAFCIFLLKSGDAFLMNGYYFLMIVPPIAVIVGFGVALLKSRRLQLILIFIVAVENIANQIHVFQVRPTYQPYTQLENIFDSLGSSNQDLVAVANGDGSPMAIYLSHRKGWNVSVDFLKNEQNVKQMLERGCKYILILKVTFGDTELPYTTVFNSSDFKIYKL
jgi:4-amino-4-deoxy-L-arabinose transferase-like glycosyltransferase